MGKFLNPTLANHLCYWSKVSTYIGNSCMLLGQFFIVVNGQMLNKKSAQLVTLQISHLLHKFARSHIFDELKDG